MRGAGVLLMSLFASTALADYKLNLVGSTTSLSPSGQSIQLTGSGSFDPQGERVKLGGSFVVFTPDGVAIRRGSWHAHRFNKFTPWRGDRDLGGVLEVMVTLVSESGVLEQEPMRLTCVVNKPPADGEEEGVTIGPFLEAAGGVVRFVRR